MSSNASNLIEKTLSQSQSQLLLKTFRGVEEEIIAKINNFRLKISTVKEKLEEIIKESSNPEEHTITIKELNKTINYESQENLDKLTNYLSYLSELKHTIPDFFHTPSLNSVFTRNFGSIIDNQKGLLQKSNESNEKLKKIIPSKNYLGIYIPNVEIKDIESILCFLILEEFFMLSSKDARLKSDNLVIEANTDEIPQHISIFNPFFNTLVAYAGEKEQHLYLLFLTDVLELMGPEGADFPFGSRSETIDFNKKPKFSTTVVKLDSRIHEPHMRKYDHLKTSLPDITLEQAQRFTTTLDSDNDFRITVLDVVHLAQKHKLVLEESVINEMFEDIFQRRCVKVESERRKPVDAHEVFHAVKYKYKKDPQTSEWVTTSRPFRAQWLMLFKLLGVELPKHALPSLKTTQLLCNYELGGTQKFKATSPIFGKPQPIIAKDKKPEVLKKQYQPEAGILIQNTQHIMELYNDDRDHAKQEDSNKNAFQTLVNAKFQDVTRRTEYQTVDFNSQEYYKEALRLSKDPELYLNEKVNPIFKYLPVKKDYVYQQHPQEIESLKDTRSGMQTDEVEFDESVEANAGSKRVTMYSIREPLTRMSKSVKSIKPTPIEENNKMYGSLTRHTTLSSSIKHREHSPQATQSKRPIFMTSFKIPDNQTLRFTKAKLEPIVDAYYPPQNHLFRDDIPPEDKPQFMDRWQKEIPDIIGDDKTTDGRPKEALEREIWEREQQLLRLRGIKKNPHPWTRYFKLAPREKDFVTQKYPEFLEKGDYTDGFIRVASFLKPEVGADVPFKLFHRALRKTDKNLFFGENHVSKY